MHKTTRIMPPHKHIALVAHDSYKPELLRWVKKHQEKLEKHSLYATGTTGRVLSNETGLKIKNLTSGPLGGDQQLGALVSTKEIDMIIFFWDPLNAMSHDPDIKALLRISTVWNIPIAINAASADFFFESSLLKNDVEIEIPDYEKYISERV